MWQCQSALYLTFYRRRPAVLFVVWNGPTYGLEVFQNCPVLQFAYSVVVVEGPWVLTVLYSVFR